RLRQRFLVQRGKPWKTHHCTSGPEAILLGSDIRCRMVEDSRTHLAGYKTIPDKCIEGMLFGVQITLHMVRRAQDWGGPDRFMGLLRCLLAPIPAWLRGHIVFAIALVNVLTHFLHCFISEPGGIRSHVRDESHLPFITERQPLIELLGHAH